MDLASAIASGKRFRRPASAAWIAWASQDNFIFKGEDLTALDFILEEKTTKATKAELLTACQGAGMAWTANNAKFLALCALLGL